MNILSRYKSIVAASVSDIHAHRPVSSLGQELPSDAREQFQSLQHYTRVFLTTRKPKEEVLLDISDLSKIK